MNRNYILALIIGSLGVALLVSALATRISRDDDTQPAQKSSTPQTKTAPATSSSPTPRSAPSKVAKPAAQPKPQPNPPAPAKASGPPDCVGVTPNGFVMLMDYAEPQPQGFAKPKPGHRMISAKVRVQTLEGARKRMSSNPLNFKLRSPDGFIYGPKLGGPNIHPQIDTTDVDPNDFVLGWVTFDVPVKFDARTLKLRYEPTFGKGRTAWMPLNEALEKGTKCRAQIEAGGF